MCAPSIGIHFGRACVLDHNNRLKQTYQKQRNIIRTNAHQEHGHAINGDQHGFSQPASAMI